MNKENKNCTNKRRKLSSNSTDDELYNSQDNSDYWPDSESDNGMLYCVMCSKCKIIFEGE